MIRAGELCRCPDPGHRELAAAPAACGGVEALADAVREYMDRALVYRILNGNA